MPYIKNSDREMLDGALLELVDSIKDIDPKTENIAGNLNYIITYLMKTFLEDRKCYKNLNEMIGMLECAKQELYRKEIAPYEDIKEKQNGSV